MDRISPENRKSDEYIVFPILLLERQYMYSIFLFREKSDPLEINMFLYVPEFRIVPCKAANEHLKVSQCLFPDRFYMFFNDETHLCNTRGLQGAAKHSAATARNTEANVLLHSSHNTQKQFAIVVR